ncbi:hypothetical protein ACIQVT_34535 [Streptomyces sp. NPDC100445]|uniref:hypothetical protein n=1 Tax=Streptomyces sp. NPDC100445 TaxID=3366102 RepID=UPI0037F60E3B
MKLTTDQANAHIVTALGVSGALVLVKAGARSEMPPVRTWIGLTFAGVALATVAQSEPNIAGGIAMLMLTSAVFVYGRPAWDAIAGATKGGKTADKPEHSKSV